MWIFHIHCNASAGMLNINIQGIKYRFLDAKFFQRILKASLTQISYHVWTIWPKALPSLYLTHLTLNCWCRECEEWRVSHQREESGACGRGRYRSDGPARPLRRELHQSTWPPPQPHPQVVQRLGLGRCSLQGQDLPQRKSIVQSTDNLTVTWKKAVNMTD